MTLQSNTPASPTETSTLVSSETTQSVEVAAAAPAPAVEATDSGESAATPATTTETASSSSETVATPTTITWNGELSSLEDAAWWKEQVSEEARTVLRAGWEAKAKNLEGDYTRKMQDMAAQRKEMEAERKSWGEERAELQRYKRWLENGEDLDTQYQQELVQTKARISELEALQESAAATAREEAQAEFLKQFEPVQAENAQLIRERDEAIQKHQEAERLYSEAIIESLTKWVFKEAPLLAETGNEEALTKFEDLLRTQAASGPEEAYRMVSAIYPNVRAKKSLPAALEVMHTDAPASFTPPAPEVKQLSYSELKNQMMRKAEGRV